MAMILRGSVFVPASIERTWDLWTDAARYPQWQGGVLAIQDLSGPVGEVGTTYVLDHGPKLKREVRVVAAERPVRHVIEQSGVGVTDQTVATFEPEGDGTRVTIAIYAHLNAVMRLLARLDRHERLQRELQRELERFAGVAARHPGPARLGGIYVVLAGAVRRRATVIGLDPDRIHVRLHPGHLRDRDPDDLVPRSPKPPTDQMDLWPIPPPLRGGVAITQKGLPFLVRDGGHGIAHLALSRDAWADASAKEIATEEVSVGDVAAVDDWRARSGPTVGVDADLALAPMCTLRLGIDGAGGEVWAAAAVLRSEIMRVHLAIPGARWAKRPERIDLWRHRARGVGDEPLRTGIGHAPVNRSAFKGADPVFVGITTIESGELEGYRIWRERKGGTFDTLQPLVDPPHMDDAPRAAMGE